VLVDQFKAEDQHVVGAEAPIKHESSFLSQNVNWKVQSGGFTDVMISLHFKSRQDNKVRQCKMRLASTHSYEDAKKFVVKLQNLTSSDLKYDSFKVPAVKFESLPLKKKSFWSMTRRKV
jgi:plasmid maintenance system killer protein